MDALPESIGMGENRARSGVLHELAWFISGAVLPMGSLTFYREASRRRVGLAILFFFVFTIFISVLTTATVGVSMAVIVPQIHKAYQQGSMVKITIRDGIAEVDGPQPWILAENHVDPESMFVAADTTGRISSIDTSRYRQGFLLTRTELHILTTSQGYQRVPLSEINTAFQQNPIVLDEGAVTNLWMILGAMTTLLVFIGLVLWNSVLRLMVTCMLALIFWGIVSLFRPKTGFGPFVITGMYAFVPAIYISHLFTRSQISFPGLQTLLLFVFWGIGLLSALLENKFLETGVTRHLWTALIGVPMLALFIVDMFAMLPSPGGDIALWGLALVTIVALMGVRLYLRWRDRHPPTSPVQPIPPQIPSPS